MWVANDDIPSGVSPNKIIDPALTHSYKSMSLRLPIPKEEGRGSCLAQTSNAHTVADKQSPPILRPWVFLFGAWQEHPWRLGNAGKPVFRVYWRDWHEPISLKLNIYHFEPQNFGGHPKQLAKNPEKCAIDSFFKAEDDPTKIEHFVQAVRQIYSL